MSWRETVYRNRWVADMEQRQDHIRQSAHICYDPEDWPDEREVFWPRATAISEKLQRGDKNANKKRN